MKHIIRFWQCIFGQLVLIGCINIVVSLITNQPVGYFKWMLFLLFNYHFVIDYHPTNELNIFTCAIYNRFTAEETDTERKVNKDGQGKTE